MFRSSCGRWAVAWTPNDCPGIALMEKLNPALLPGVSVPWKQMRNPEGVPCLTVTN